jgi:LPXTG-motif cell wall-anchored protein
MKQKLAMMTVLFLLVGGALYAQQDMGNTPAPQATYMTGVVQSSSPTSLTIRNDSGEVLNLVVDSHTVGAENLKTGDRVRVEYNHNTEGQNVAEEIQANPSNLAESQSSSATGATSGTEQESAATEQAEQTTGTEATPSTATEPNNTYSNEPSTNPSPYATPQSSTSSSSSTSTTTETEPQENNVDTSATSQTGLPKTGSNLPAFALLGLLALAGAATVRFLH